MLVFGMPLSVFLIYFIAGPVVIVAGQILSKTKWWNDLCDYYTKI